jgi:prefoldin subunit 5
MLNAEQAIESIQRDRDTLKLISGLQDNVRTLKEIIDQLEWRIRRLEDNE